MSNDVIRVGDRFLVEVEVDSLTQLNPAHAPCTLCMIGSADYLVTLPDRILLAGKRLPRPLKVGDLARVHYGAPVTIKAIDGSDAWVMTEDGGRFTTELNFLTPAEESAS